MVSIIKNQLLKHLSRYTKNLSSDKINISTFRGEGELSNLQLDEDVLNDLLELPAWLRLTSAWCNHVSFRVSWTKLKSVPITIVLDEVNVTLETCDFDANGQRRRSGAAAAGPSGSAGSPPPPLQGKYSFIHRIIDGITIVVNTVNVKFNSPAFVASVQMSRIRVESKTPRWLSGDLRVTRLKDEAHAQLLIFKELSWQTVRIEASSTQDLTLTPLRLLTNQARCRITIKKRLSDCQILSSRLVLILDDLLWVLTDSQLKAALHFVDSLAALIKRSTQLTQRIKAQKKLATMPSTAGSKYQAASSGQQHQQGAASVSPAQKSFNMFDVHETSYHFFSQRIDLHLCDDPGEGRSCYPDLKDGGALQISVQGFQVDYYPFHLANSSRAHWPKYKESAVAPALWLEQSLSAFRETLLQRSQPSRFAGGFAAPAHAPLERAAAGNNGLYETIIQPPGATGAASTNPFLQASSTSANEQSPLRRRFAESYNKLMTACVVVRIEDFTLYRVTTSGKKQMPKEFVSCDKDRYSFPGDLSTIHAEFTYFFYPGDSNFPLPPNKMFVHVNPVQIHFHLDSCLWLNSFGHNLQESLRRAATQQQQQQQNASGDANEATPGLMYMDVKFEAIMPRIVLECPADAPVQRDRPKAMQVQISRLMCTNIRELGATRADLAQALHSLQEGSLVFASDFPTRPDDLCVVTDRILSHVAATDVSATSSTSTPTSTQPTSPTPTLTSEAHSPLGRWSFCAEPRDVWCLKLDPVWVDFLGARSVGHAKSVPFIDAVPITVWLHGRTAAVADDHNANPAAALLQQQQQQPNAGTADKSLADLHVIAHISNMVSVQIDHFQYLFLLRLAEELTELSTFVSLDTDRIQHNTADSTEGAGAEKSIVFGCVVPQIELTLIMPSQSPGKESSGCDAESVVPDSVSIGDDLQQQAGVAVGASAASTLEQQLLACNGDLRHPLTPQKNVTSAAQQSEAASRPVPDSGGSQYSQSVTSPKHSVYSTSGGDPAAGVSAPISMQSPPPQSMTSSMTSTRSRTARGSMGGESGGGGLKEFGSSLMTMKKGFSSFMTSIDSALKSTGPLGAGADDASDSFSIQSDISSDSENFALVLGDDRTTDCMDMMFTLNPFAGDQNTMKASAIEVASEVCEEAEEHPQQHQPHSQTNLSSPSEPSDANSWRRRDLVSMVTFRLTTVEVIHQTIGRTSSLRLQLSALTCDECNAIPWDELQAKTKFGARCRAWNIAPYNPEAPPCVRLRMDEVRQPPKEPGIIADKKTVLDWFDSRVEIRVKDLNMDLSMSTVIGLVDLAEDEIIGKPLPAEILLENVRMHLVEDRPPVNVTSPGSVPIDLHIGRMRVTRDSAGIISLQPLDNDEATGATAATDSGDRAASGELRTSDSAQLVATRSDSANTIGGGGGGGGTGRDREVLALQLVMQQLKLDNEQLKWQLRLNEKSAENVIHTSMQEAEVLKNCLNKAQLDIAQLLTEKQTLLNTVRSLQKQLLATGQVLSTASSPDGGHSGR